MAQKSLRAAEGLPSQVLSDSIEGPEPNEDTQENQAAFSNHPAVPGPCSRPRRRAAYLVAGPLHVNRAVKPFEPARKPPNPSKPPPRVCAEGLPPGSPKQPDQHRPSQTRPEQNQRLTSRKPSPRPARSRARAASNRQLLSPQAHMTRSRQKRLLACGKACFIL